MAMDSASERETITKALSSLDPFVNHDTGLLQLRLCFELIGHSGTELEKATLLAEFHNILLSSTTHKGRATALVRYMLSVIIGVHGSEKLKCGKEELENCKPILAFSSVIVGVCKGLGVNDFKKLKVAICRDHLGCVPGNITSPENLFSKLFHKTVIVASDVSLLVYWLRDTSVGRSDLAKDVLVYARNFAFPLFLEESLQDKLSQDKFNKLAELCCQHLECSHDLVSSPKHLVSKLQDAKIVSLEDPTLLTTQWLRHASVDSDNLAQEITVHSNKYMEHSPDPTPELQLATAPVQETSGGDSQLLGGVKAGGHRSVLAVGPSRSDPQGVHSNSVGAGTEIFKFNIGDEEKDAAHQQQHSNTTGFVSTPLSPSTKSATTTMTITGNRKPGAPAVSSSQLTCPTPPITRDTSFSKLSNALPQGIPQRQDSDSSTKETDTLLTPETPDNIVNPMILSGENRGRSKKLSKCLVCMCFVVFGCLGLIVLASIVTIGFGIYGWYCTPTSTRVLARGGDSVVVATITDPLSLVWNVVSECLKEGDESHTSELYLVQEDQLKKHTRSRVRTSSEIFNQSEPSCKTGFLGTEHLLYLLPNSTIEYRICLSSDDETNELGKLFIFENDVSYENYIDQDYPCSADQTTFKHDLIIGTPGNFECTNISFTASMNGYHYVVSKTPGNVRFSYTYDVNQRYLDPTDLRDTFCTFYSATHDTCILRVPKLFTRTVVVDHVVSNEGSNPVTTHVCLESQWMRGLIGIVSTFAVIFVLVLVFFVAIVAVVCWCRKNNSRCKVFTTRHSRLKHVTALHQST